MKPRILANLTLIAIVPIACAPASITPNQVAGIYECQNCGPSGERLILRSDSSFSRCVYSDVPIFEDSFKREYNGTYELDSSRIILVVTQSDETISQYLVKIRNVFYLVSEETYDQWSDNNDVIADLGIKQDKREFPPANSACAK